MLFKAYEEKNEGGEASLSNPLKEAIIRFPDKNIKLTKPMHLFSYEEHWQ